MKQGSRACGLQVSIILNDIHIVSPVVSICISLVTNDAKQFIQVSSWVVLTQWPVVPWQHLYFLVWCILDSPWTFSAPHPYLQTWNQSISSTDICFFSVGDNIQSLESGCQGSHCDWIGHYFWSFPVAELGNIIFVLKNSFLFFFLFGCAGS